MNDTGTISTGAIIDRGRWLGGWACLISLLAAWLPGALVVADPPSPSVPITASPSNKAGALNRAARFSGSGTLEDRVRGLATALGLDSAQQAKLRKILIDQRDKVRKIWSDNALPPTERAPATRAVNERTGDDIRAILNDEQKKKYNPPKPATPLAPQDQRSVEQWMDAAKPH